jgi:hypothetical protein
VRAPTPSELLAVWERCATRTPAEHALELLALASPDAPVAGLESLTAGERDGRLLDVRERAFGSVLFGAASCGLCHELVEFSVRTENVRVEPRSRAEETLTLSCDGYDLRFRLPTGADVKAISRERDPASARRRLIDRCVLSARSDGAEVTAEALPEPVTEALAARMAEADPQADVELVLSCPACGHAWNASFDVASFLWSELDAWTRRTLHDVHVLASAYGWSEPEILALGPRRQLYLELVRG